MRKTLGTCLLVLFLTSSANAGLIPNWEPTPPPSSTVTTSDGLIPNDTANSLTEIVLDLLAVLPLL